MDAELPLHKRAAKLLAADHRQMTVDEQGASLQELVELYHAIAETDEKLARDIRLGFLLNLVERPEVLAGDRLANFLVDCVRPQDFAELQWESPDQVITLCEMLYSYPFETNAGAERIKVYVQHLLRYALQAFEKRGDLEQMFQLLQLAPTLPVARDTELLRLRNRAYLYEVRRVQRTRRWLYGYLILQVFLIVVVFPLLFINAENGAIQKQIEEAADVDLPQEVNRFFSYTDGLYWALITAASIGYGDVTPLTTVGKIIAATLGVMGVITIGVIAGLILRWITPRTLD